jgi:uncharacterized protein
MGRPTGRADLPLHGGHVPPWLATRMAALGRTMTEAIVLHAGREEFLRRLAHPFWFQSFGAVMGMDWHSSGITTSVLGALERGLRPIADDLGLWVCGGRGRHSRRTPAQLLAIGERRGLPGDALARTSRLVAKVDSAAVQDGFSLYLHAFVVADDGAWVVVQQGMNDAKRQARRYHWLSHGLESFLDDPHAAIEGADQGQILNLADRRAARSRAAQIDLVHSGPDRVLALLRRPEVAPVVAELPFLQMPAHHDVRSSDVVERRLHATLRAAAEVGPRDFADLLLVPGVGARTVAALAHVAEVVYGEPHRFSDPGRFSFAHGGKDGHPFPVPLRVYDETIRVLTDAVARARLGQDDRLAAIRTLDRHARAVERADAGQPWETLIAGERERSWRYGGMTVSGPARRPGGTAGARETNARQLGLFDRRGRVPSR